MNYSKYVAWPLGAALLGLAVGLLIPAPNLSFLRHLPWHWSTSGLCLVIGGVVGLARMGADEAEVEEENLSASELRSQEAYERRLQQEYDRRFEA